ncbi:B3 domain-containing transcription factor VRN1-like isoform X2 [Solanum pennellii]|uniref:B3 domain-containing transcription factor VRN1-like isoform X2 n=1 Tax=Solanum pennellii TaxID=28526 RepID=A0ABM1GZ36_SOLPN|nr:B3 domain-containing transcription factor VRN1-like isoform X2 [Solanum pennellii]
MERNYVGNGFPAFIKVYSPETCYLKLKIPSRFLKNLNGDIPVISLLEVEGSARRSWRVVIEKIEEDFYFKGGWTKFVQDNNLENEDYLNFLYAGNSTFSVKIYGKNGYLKQELNAIAELELHPLDEENPNEIQVVSPLADEELDGSENSLVSVTLFEIVMKRSNFSKMLLNLPSTFGKKYMKRGHVFEKMATLQTDGKSWPVVVRSSDRLKLRKGWRQYLQDNDLHVGDVLRFKLIDEENFILKVLIRRNPSHVEVLS